MFTFDNIFLVWNVLVLANSIRTIPSEPIDNFLRMILAFFLVVFLGCTVMALRDGRPQIAAVLLGWAVLFAYVLWRDRPNKRKYIDKVLGRVKDLGHRLVVVNT